MTDSPYTLWRERADDAAPFVVCAMFTADYQPQAMRLAASLERLGLAHALFQVAQVHRSISPRGGDDLAASKTRFITFALTRFAKPILYVDADVVFRAPPVLIAALCAQGCDFAIYNWLADAMNDAWRPADNQASGPRFWQFFFSVDALSDAQMIGSGAVQLWRDTPAARALLADWEHALLRHPRSEDDQCLDFAFNHGDRAGLQVRWLPKEYARYAFWPYADAVIDHPEFPMPIAGQFEALGMARVDRAKITLAKKQPSFPREAILDAQERILLLPAAGGPAPAGPLPRPLFVA